MWEHPTLVRSLRKVFRQEKTPIPRRSLTDSLLQAANERAYMREFGKTGSQGGRNYGSSASPPNMGGNYRQFWGCAELPELFFGEYDFSCAFPNASEDFRLQASHQDLMATPLPALQSVLRLLFLNASEQRLGF